MIKINVLGKQPDQDELDSAWWWTVPLVILLGLIGYVGYHAYSLWSAKSDEPQIITIPVSGVSLEAPEDSEPAWENGMDNADLQDAYDLINTRYFAGKLPNAVLRFKVIKGYLGLTKDADSNHPIIYVNPKGTPSPKEVIFVLNHEACHTSLKGPKPMHGSDHGKEFQACMLRLANAGAFSVVW